MDKERWAVVEDDDLPDEVHVVPLFPPEHDRSSKCWCDPVVEQLEKLLVIHNEPQ